MRGGLSNRTIGKYMLTKWLGSGGMGEVYKAEHISTRLPAAIKILSRTDQAARFQNEAYIQASVKHPNIAALYEYVIEDGLPCIIMEYVEGPTLEKLIMRHRRLPEAYALQLLEQLVSAVVLLHEHGIIHRDIKSCNIKITTEGEARLLDFGIAKAAYTPRLTQEGYVIGTTYSMAPEQFQNRVSEHSDCWSLGVLLYEMLTGYRPFDGKTETEIRVKIERGMYMSPDLLVPELSRHSRKLIKRLLTHQPKNRMTAAELLDLLRNPEETPLARLSGWLAGFIPKS
ncbi:serine/threonine protein kinase [Arundinibacter roseus]|uniref:Serine/threonine protein kinase n=1 Tax=Arundinibacter roseus TaxID=2070510 RepID=A0A4R4KPJ8_9BACT|nr:serine/threonine-protein kinase [Arundinibacter roseus]TDB68836.1 serine/threonine protein kinase [Arundinibacter roseus]